MSQRHFSLQQIYRRRMDVPLLILAAACVLGLGLTLPVLTVRKLVFWQDGWSMLTGIVQLFREGHLFIAMVLVVFSVLFPMAKLLLLLFVWLVPQPAQQRHNALHWLGLLGKWSMLDVFVVALVVVISKSGSLLDAQPRVGLYVFAAAIAMSMLLTMYVHHLAKKVKVLPQMIVHGAPPPPPLRDESK